MAKYFGCQIEDDGTLAMVSYRDMRDITGRKLALAQIVDDELSGHMNGVPGKDYKLLGSLVIGEHDPSLILEVEAYCAALELEVARVRRKWLQVRPWPHDKTVNYGPQNAKCGPRLLEKGLPT